MKILGAEESLHKDNL